MREFKYHKASKTLAHGRIHGKRSACTIFDVYPGTYDRWKQRLKKDAKLKLLFDKDLKRMIEEWEAEITESIKAGLKTLNTALENHPFEAKPDTETGRKNWGYNVDFLAKAVKNVGELGLGAKVLGEDDEEPENEIDNNSVT